MKTLIILSILCLGIASGIFAQKIEFSGYLASSGGVHTSTPSVVDKDGNIFVAGGSKQRILDPVVNFSKEGKLIITSMCVTPDFPPTFKNAEPDKSWTNCIWKFDLRGK